MYSNSTHFHRLTLKPVNPEVPVPGSASLTKALFFSTSQRNFPHFHHPKTSPLRAKVLPASLFP